MKDYIKHFGTEGMHWGVRKYQYPDGRFTPEGYERYFGTKGEKQSRITLEANGQRGFISSTSNLLRDLNGIFINNNKVKDVLKSSGEKEVEAILDRYGDMSMTDALKLSRWEDFLYAAKQFGPFGAKNYGTVSSTDQANIIRQKYPKEVEYQKKLEKERKDKAAKLDEQIYKKNIFTKKDLEDTDFIWNEIQSFIKYYPTLQDSIGLSKIKKSELKKITRIWNDHSLDEYEEFKDIPKYKTKGISEENWKNVWQFYEG